METKTQIETQKELNSEMVVEEFKKLLAVYDNDTNLCLTKLGVAPEHMAEASIAFKNLLNGDKSLMDELEVSMHPAPSNARGGVTKYVVLTKWGIPYGGKLYIDHKTLNDSASMAVMIATITALVGVAGALLAIGLVIGITSLRTIDRGNGVIITQIPLGLGACIPSPQ